MRNLLDDVSAFHVACDVPILARPAVPSKDRKRLRIKLIDEEVNKELLPAMEADDLVETADAMADSIYVIVGAALEYGLPLDRVWDAVQRANMAKADPVTGKVRKRDDGKVLKPDGWAPPDIAAIVQRASADNRLIADLPGMPTKIAVRLLHFGLEYEQQILSFGREGFLKSKPSAADEWTMMALDKAFGMPWPQAEV